MTARWGLPSIHDVSKVIIGPTRYSRVISFESNDGSYVEFSIYSDNEKPIAVEIREEETVA